MMKKVCMKFGRIAAGLWLGLTVSLATAGDITGVGPDFTLKSASGKNLKLSEMRGEVVMINFWASWCGPCREEMPLLEKMYQKYKPMGFTLLGVNVEEDSAAAQKMLQDIPVSFPVMFDDKQQVSKQYQVVAMPSTVLLDRSGNVRKVFKGYQPGFEKKYENEIKQLLRE